MNQILKAVPIKKNMVVAFVSLWCRWVIPLVAGLGTGVVAVVAAPVAVAAAGFASGGIAVGSVAASMMSSAAISSGGGVAAGSAVATLQAVGATGSLAAAGGSVTAAVGSIGASIGAGIGWLTSKLLGRKNNGHDGSNDDQSGGCIRLKKRSWTI